MVAALGHPETVFTVLASAARQRSSRTLIAQLLLCVATGAAILVVVPQWWSLAALLGAPATYAAWGIIAHLGIAQRIPRTVRALLLAVAIAGTALAAAGTLGLAFAVFTGNGRSPYTPCGPRSTSRYCRATGQPALRPLPVP